MLQELQIRNYSARTVVSYIHCIERLSVYYKSSPDLLSLEQIKSYLHYCVVEKQESASTLNQIISAVRILYVDVLHRTWEPIKLKRPRREKQLPCGYYKIRYYGIFSSIHTKTTMQQCFALLGSSPGISQYEGLVMSEVLYLITGHDITKCPQCKTGRMIVVAPSDTDGS